MVGHASNSWASCDLVLLDLFQLVAPLMKPSAVAAVFYPLVVFQALLLSAVLLLVDVFVRPDAHYTLRKPFL